MVVSVVVFSVAFSCTPGVAGPPPGVVLVVSGVWVVTSVAAADAASSCALVAVSWVHGEPKSSVVSIVRNKVEGRRISE